MARGHEARAVAVLYEAATALADEWDDCACGTAGEHNAPGCETYAYITRMNEAIGDLQFALHISGVVVQVERDALVEAARRAPGGGG